ncbi:very short patch repair endonuclease [Spectribacter hydrogenoxidans]|uniref:Very short patch repair endonuclease n=1 Tax=Spectribacter hydrogenoxidans TaxID=3075608 RepID=A0ABU3BWH0_9GAMM|nr:very short patch repair endonuclease [Salinisphaera sp. W335]MDT0633641.1 very short patch repair endonuclease [Salinisphaera sp. W335]
MNDIVNKPTRSRMMARVGSKNTKPELALRRLLHKRGFRYRLHGSELPGRPDLVFVKYGAVVFVHGCFWHRHPGCKHASSPSTRSEFWQSKFRENIERDARNLSKLRRAGWRIAVVWACALENPRLERSAEKLAIWLESSEPELQVG